MAGMILYIDDETDVHPDIMKAFASVLAHAPVMHGIAFLLVLVPVLNARHGVEPRHTEEMLPLSVYHTRAGKSLTRHS